MKTPAKDQISALRSGSYGVFTPLTSTSTTSPISSLKVHKLEGVSLFPRNELMAELELQNVRLMEKYLDFLEQRRKLRDHCTKGINFAEQENWQGAKEELVIMYQILSNKERVQQKDQPHDNQVGLRQQIQKHEDLIQQLKSVITSYEILPNTKQQILVNEIIIPQLLRLDLSNLAEQLYNIEIQIISGIKHQLNKVTRLFRDNKIINEIHLEGHFQFELSELIQVIKTVIKTKIKEIQGYQSPNTSLDKIVKQTNKYQGSGFMSKNKDMERDQTLYSVLVTQAQSIQKLLDENYTAEQHQGF